MVAFQHRTEIDHEHGWQYFCYSWWEGWQRSAHRCRAASTHSSPCSTGWISLIRKRVMKILFFIFSWLTTERWGENQKNSTLQACTKGHNLHQGKVRQNQSNCIKVLLSIHEEEQGISACAETHWAFSLTLPYLWALVLLSHKWTKKASALKATQIK